MCYMPRMTGGKRGFSRQRSLAELPGPRGLPWLGNLLELDQARFHLTLESFWRRYGELFSFRIGPQRCLGVAAPELVRSALRERPHDFRRMQSMESVARELGMHGVFSAEGDDWKRQRALIMPAFREDNLVRHFAALREISVRLGDRIAQRHEAQDVLEPLMRFTVDVLAQVALGRELHSLSRGDGELQGQLETIFSMLLRRVLAPFPYWHYVTLPGDRALERALRGARAQLLPFIEQARSALHDDAQRRATPPSLMEAMLVAASDGAQRLSDTEVLANVFTLLLAGEDTTANTLAWIVHFIASDPALQRALQAEVDAALGPEPSLPSHAHMQQLPLLTGVVHETLRLKGPAPFIALSAARDVQLGELEVPAGTPVFVLLRALALEVDHTFDPRRWLNAATRTQLARTSIPFGAGPRICPGRQLALLECALACSALLRRFDCTASGEPVAERFDFAMEPEGLRVTFSERRRL